MRKGLSPVIASVILSGMVLVIGAGVWSYSYGAASTMANDYTDETINMVHTIIERFNIEKVHYDSSTDTVNVWVYNYGNIGITVTTTVTINGNSYPETEIETEIDSKQIEPISILISGEVNPLPSYQEIVVTVQTERENREYEVYYVP
ncbi:hypothetical protein GF326_05500 [Candidatus Bathyarchaeota archaeon]|nr:hypothetical protein [Candidatus Bathyarchaeota archaeon]